MSDIKRSAITLIFSMLCLGAMAQTVYEGNSVYGRTLFCWDGTYAYSGEMADQYIPYTWSPSNNWIYAGKGTAGDRLFYWDGTRLFRGNAEYNVVICRWDGTHLLRGQSDEILYTVADGRIRSGNESGPVIASYEGEIPAFVMYLMLTY